MAQVNFRVDDKLKTDVESLYRGLGLTLSAAFTLFAHQSLIHRGLPFQVSVLDPSGIAVSSARMPRLCRRPLFRTATSDERTRRM